MEGESLHLWLNRSPAEYNESWMAETRGEPSLEPWILDLEHSSNILYVLDSGLRIIFCNQAWDDFALQNEGENLIRSAVLGQPILPAIVLPLRDFFEAVFQHARKSRKPFELEYECSSPEFYRVFHMRILPMRTRDQLLVSHALAVERPHGLERPAQSAELAHYMDAHGLLHMCSHCRRTRHNGGTAWDWVPSYLNDAPAPVSHGLCPACMAYFYPAQWQRLRHRLQLR